jgi:hypothetical protein
VLIDVGGDDDGADVVEVHGRSSQQRKKSDTRPGVGPPRLGIRLWAVKNSRNQRWIFSPAAVMTRGSPETRAILVPSRRISSPFTASVRLSIDRDRLGKAFWANRDR